jgi:hypothetical protein
VGGVVFLEPALGFAQPLGARGRDRLRFRRALLVEPALCIAQPGTAALAGLERGRQLVAAALAEALVLLAVELFGLGEDLLCKRLVVGVAVLRGVGVELRAIDREQRHRCQAGVGAERQHLPEQLCERLLVAAAKARDRRVVGALVGRHDSHRYVLEAGALDGARGAPAGRVAVEQERDHHLRVVRRAAVAVCAVAGVEGLEIELLGRRQDEPSEVVVGEPLAQARRHQQLLVAVAGQEVLRHRWIVQSGPDGVAFVQQPP